MKLFGQVKVGALDQIPVIRLQFSEEAFGLEPESHVDVAIASCTAAEIIQLLQNALDAQQRRLATAPPEQATLRRVN